MSQRPPSVAHDPAGAVTVTVGVDGTWSLQSGRVRPEDWVAEKPDPSIPHTVLAADAERNFDGGFGYQAV